MSAQTTAIVVMVLLVVILIVGALQLMHFLFRRAVRKVVALFRQQGATSPARAKSPAELGLAPVNPLDRMFRFRDYRPEALRALGQADIIKWTEEGSLYLSEDELERSPLKKLVGIK